MLVRFFTVAFVFLAEVLLPVAVNAQAQSTVPEFNPLCWQEDQCLTARRQIMTGGTTQQIKDGWVTGEAPCAKPGWGKCLPGGITFTQISFAGRHKFLHLGDFIQTMYKYLISLAAVVAVAVLMWAGFTWVTSGGSAEKIGEAKKRIGGALMGLLIAYLSYLILQTLNPALVNLRLPQIWLVRPQNLVPEFCSAASSTGKFALAAEDSSKEGQQQPLPPPAAGLTFDLRFGGRPANDLTFYCGKRFWVEGAGSTACFGDECSGDKRCLPDYSSPQKFWWCQEGNIAIFITHRSFAKQFVPDIISEEWVDPPVTSVSLDAVCLLPGGGTPTTAVNDRPVEPTTLSDGKTQWLVLNVKRERIAAVLKQCENNKGQLKGFALRVDFNETYDPIDEMHYLGRNGVDLGDRGKLRAGFFDKYVQDLPEALFFNRAEVEDGLNLTIEAAAVKDIDSEKDRVIYYRRFGISP